MRRKLMAFHNLGKQSPLDMAGASDPSFAVRLLPVVLTAWTSPLFAQAALTSDLWRVAAGTLTVPAPLVAGGTAAVWTPAFTLGGDTTLRLAVETIHAPAEVGVDGALLSAGWQAARNTTVNVVYGRIGLGDLVRTETSPEAIGGEIPAYAQVVSLGVARRIGGSWTAGGALRLLSGRLDTRSRNQVGVDFGVVWTRSRLRLGATTRAFDPTLGEGEDASSYSVAADYRSRPFALDGASAVLAFRYGLTLSHGEAPQQLLSAGLLLGTALEMDAGAAREEVAGTEIWRGRFGLTIRSGRYAVALARDGGVNGFDGTFRFGLTAVFR